MRAVLTEDELRLRGEGDVPVNRERAFESSSRAFSAGVEFCEGYRGSISLANGEAQDELIEPENSHLRIMRNNPVSPEFAPRSQNKSFIFNTPPT